MSTVFLVVIKQILPVVPLCYPQYTFPPSFMYPFNDIGFLFKNLYTIPVKLLINLLLYTNIGHTNVICNCRIYPALSVEVVGQGFCRNYHL